ncbi:MAG: UDP-glucose/GDP-mannose dehydrogenase family protein [Clostridia bacterium]|nr:UDP-glucose/GDP-mannose dehydrogenase family protein [Clostridia bacterium]
MKITIAGTGYVGLVSATVLAEVGHDVCCVDVDKAKIEYLVNGGCPIFEPGLQELIVKNKSRLSFTTDAETAYKNSDVIFIAVGTPEKKDGSANLQYVLAVCDVIANFVEKDTVIVVKSTVPIGTNDRIEEYVKSKAKCGLNFEIVSNPEFLSQGTAIEDMLFPNRIIIGVESESSKTVMQKIYEPFNCPILFTNRRSAEMVKYASNDFLALKISYVNEIANLCEALGADISDVTLGMGLDPRIGNKFLGAGIGYGGSCFPKDTKALHWLSGTMDCAVKTIQAAIEVNDAQKTILLKKAKKYYSSFEGLNIAILGLAFKSGTDDLREAPSLSNIPILLDYGAKIKAWDTTAEKNFRKLYPTEIQYCNTPQDALKDADLCLIMTDWPEIKALSPEVFSLMAKPIILDGRNCYPLSLMKNYKVVYESIGRITINNLS